MRRVFNLDFSILSRVVKLFNVHIIENFDFLLLDNLLYWQPFFSSFAEAIRSKLLDKCGIYYPPGRFRVALFHDDTVIATCRPGGGPVRAGIDQNRHDNFIQMAFYNGWKKHHGYKFQTTEAPNGMCVDMFGPKTFRQNDIQLLNDSMLNDRLREVQRGQPVQYCSYGDGIFPINTHTIGKHIGETTADERFENRMMSRFAFPTNGHTAKRTTCFLSLSGNLGKKFDVIVSSQDIILWLPYFEICIPACMDRSLRPISIACLLL